MAFYKKTVVTPVLVAACLVVAGCSDSDNSASVDQDSSVSADGGDSVSSEILIEPDTDATTQSDAVVDTDDTLPVGTETVVDDGAETIADGDTETTADGGTETTADGGTETTADGGTVIPVVEPSATGADLSGGEDDSPTLTESLSLVGPFTVDPTRGAGPPSAPTGLVPLMASDNWVEFSWVPSADDQSVEAYEIYRDGELIATVRGDTGYEHDYRSWLSTSFIDCNYTRYTNCVDEALQPQTGASYAYSVVAVDNEGMRSAPSEEVLMSMATPGQAAVDLSGYNVVFSEEFDGTSLDRSRWKTSLPWGPDEIINVEQQYFVNTFGSSNPVDYDPFVFTGETLQITGIATPADQLEAANGQPFLSGVLSTSDFFEMTYGYVEMRAKFAGGDGLLSTFYLFNQDFFKNKPEIDIAEYIGTRADKVYQTYHYYDSNRARTPSGEKHSSPTMETVTNQNLSEDFHTYSVLWEPELVIWYIDGVEVRRLEGVRVSDEPMNIVTQLVMGSVWIGDPDPASVPAVMEIDYIRAYQQ